MPHSVSGDIVEMDFERVFERWDYRKITRKLFGRSDPSEFYLDLRYVNYAYATAVVPLIALCKHLRAGGTDVEIAYPFDDSYWRTAGWTALLEGRDALPVDAARSFIPVQSYSDSARLNSVISDVLEVLARHMSCSAGVLDSIAWTLNELADNVLVHAAEPGTEAEGLIQVVSHPGQQQVDLVVSDYGRGIRKSLSQSHNPSSDEEAIRLAIEAGVTRDKAAGQGNGLAGSVRIVTAASGELTIMSGNAELDVSSGDVSAAFCGAVPGTSVCLILPTNVEIDISKALWGSPPTPEFEMTHLSEDDQIEFAVAQEASGFGNRATGRQLRLKLRNLMDQFRDSKAQVDFADVGLISASFADEFIAKLVVEMGHFSFFSRVSLKNANPFVVRTLDNVISQRSQAPHISPNGPAIGDFAQ
ncbi:ATP-binding protein [Candidatus Poriferisodalis sp.]|uniref:ATP-binding protein n=1 Tax=Candidatus Poriferisodalis sp. TaxID=3101277 RepID=UPI003AF87344